MKPSPPPPPAAYDLVVWDWNGTLLDDAWLCRDCINGLLRRRGLPELSAARYMEIFDFPVVDYYRRAGFDFESESFEKLGMEFMDDYHARRPGCRLQPGASDLLETLAARGLRQAVLSASEHESLEQALRLFGIRGRFTEVMGTGDHYAGGKEEQGLQLMARMKPDPARVLLVGDTRHDHDVARAMGVDCLLVTAGNHTRERLESTGRPVFNSLLDLVGHWA